MVTTPYPPLPLGWQSSFAHEHVAGAVLADAFRCVTKPGFTSTLRRASGSRLGRKTSESSSATALALIMCIPRAVEPVEPSNTCITTASSGKMRKSGILLKKTRVTWDGHPETKDQRCCGQAVRLCRYVKSPELWASLAAALRQISEKAPSSVLTPSSDARSP